jgi:hypothetical protein
MQQNPTKEDLFIARENWVKRSISSLIKKSWRNWPELFKKHVIIISLLYFLHFSLTEPGSLYVDP